MFIIPYFDVYVLAIPHIDIRLTMEQGRLARFHIRFDVDRPMDHAPSRSLPLFN